MTFAKLPPLAGKAFADLIHAVPTPAAVCGADGTVLTVNGALLDYVGEDEHNWIGRAFADMPLTPVGSTQEGHELYVADGDEREGRRLVRTRLVVTGDGPAAVAVHFLEPYHPLAADTLHPLAAIGGRPQGVDRESGVLDRASVAHVLHAEVARCRRYGNPLAVVAIDMIDGYGAGLSGGDSLSPPAVLGQLLAEQTRWADCVGRWADRRFLLVLPETSLDSAHQLVTKMRSAAASLKPRAIYLDLTMSADEWQRGDDARTLLSRLESRLGVAETAISATA
ncbi:MAG: PAS domain-containing protein [Pseudomonadota bacterium]